MKIGQFKGEKDTDIKKLKRVQLLKNYTREIVGRVAQSVL